MYRFVLFLIALAASAGTLCADIFKYRVTWDTTALAAGYFDPNEIGIYLFYAQLSNGDGTNGNNSVTVGPVDFGGGSEVGFSQQEGGITGSLGSGLMFTDSEFSNAFLGQFNPGSHFNFDLTVSSSFDGQYFPDQFSFALYYLYNDDYSPISTQDPLGTGNFLRADLGGTPPLYRGDANVFYTFDSNRSILNPDIFIPAPVLTNISPVTSPEPSFAWLLAACIGCMLWVCRRFSVTGRKRS